MHGDGSACHPFSRKFRPTSTRPVKPHLSNCFRMKKKGKYHRYIRPCKAQLLQVAAAAMRPLLHHLAYKVCSILVCHGARLAGLAGSERCDVPMCSSLFSGISVQIRHRWCVYPFLLCRCLRLFRGFLVGPRRRLVPIPGSKVTEELLLRMALDVRCRCASRGDHGIDLRASVVLSSRAPPTHANKGPFPSGLGFYFGQ